MEHVILVDDKDNQIGTEEKLEAHKKGMLHRAFSIYIFNKKGQLMLQKRNKAKYHSGGLWANTCCSHPRPGETAKDAVHRRLLEEMGFDCELNEAFSFIYKVKLDKGLTEHEFLHVFLGNYEGEPTPNPDEVEDWKWMGMDELLSDVARNPGNCAEWLKLTLTPLSSHLKKQATGAKLVNRAV